MNNNKLPPFVKSIGREELIWGEIKMNHEQIGYILICHLIIEHYIDTYIEQVAENSKVKFNWKGAKLTTFNQKLELLINLHPGEQFNCISTIKALNIVRNKLSHNLNMELDYKTLKPIYDYLENATGKKYDGYSVNEILQKFTTNVSAYFAERFVAITYPHYSKKVSENYMKNWWYGHFKLDVN